MDESYTLFDTPVGSIGLIWNRKGITGLLLPERSARATEQSLRTRYPKATRKEPSPPIRKAITQVQNLLAGKAATLGTIALDLSDVSDFYQAVYRVARTIPPGQTQSYGEIAGALGKKGAARAVGQALGRNPIAIIIPCHRVLGQNGAIGGFSAPGGVNTKRRLLELEQARTKAPVPRIVATAKSSAPKSNVAKSSAPKSSAPKSSAPKSGAPKSSAPKSSVAKSSVAKSSVAKARKVELDDGARFLLKVEPKFRKIIENAEPMRLGTPKKIDVFLAFAKAITHQQLSGKAAASIWARVLALGPSGLSADFAQAAPLAVLRAAGLSEAKALSIRDLAERVLSGEIPERRSLAKLSNDDIIAKMTAVRGVGRWTVEMFLIFDLGRPDVLSTGDYGVRKGYSLVFGSPELPSPKELERHGERWAPYRTAATWYLWRALEQTS